MMKHLFYCLLLCNLFCMANQFHDILKTNTTQKKSTNKKQSQCAITYKLESWRRLGDNITTVCKAEYFSHVYGIPFFYKPFPYSDEFKVHSIATPFTAELEQQYQEKIVINCIQDIEDGLKSGKSILFESHFLTETPWLYCYSRQNPKYLTLIQDIFSPLTPIQTLPKPPSVITVALHVRKGGGFDMPLASQQEYDDFTPIKGIYLTKNMPANSCIDIWPIKWPASTMYIEAVKKFVAQKTRNSDYVWPVKFPPDQYYIDQLKYLADYLKDQNLLVYLFTDDPNPEAIMKRYSTALEDYPRIIFSYRKVGNHHTKNVLHDLFSLTQCDCLISASSSFAHVAQLLGNHSIIMMPTHATTYPDKVIMDKVAVFGVNNASDPQKRSLHFKEIAV